MEPSNQGEVVRSTVEETLNAMLDAKADRLCRAERCGRTEARKDTRARFPTNGTFSLPVAIGVNEEGFGEVLAIAEGSKERQGELDGVSAACLRWTSLSNGRQVISFSGHYVGNPLRGSVFPCALDYFANLSASRRAKSENRTDRLFLI